MSKLSKSTVFKGVPTFFRARCNDARRGGTASYRTAGYELARHVSNLIEGRSDEDIESKLDELAELLLPTSPSDPRKIDRELRDDSAVIAWFKREFPACIAVVPARRRGQFLTGVYEATDDDIVF